jgi:hypothetical protein
MLGVQIKQDPFTYYGSDYATSTDKQNTITYLEQIDFSALGCFSAENPIHIKVTLYSCNASNLLDYVNEIGFSDAFYENPTINPSVSATLVLKSVKGGNYTAEGNLIWHNEAETRLYCCPVLPKGTVYYNNATEIAERYPVVLHITPVADTLAFQSSHTMEQLTWVIIGLTIIMLFPVVTALMPEKQTIEVHINGVDLSKLLAEEKAKEVKKEDNKKRRKIWRKKNA